MPPTEGSALVLGHDTVRGGADIRRIVGYVPQEMSRLDRHYRLREHAHYAKIYGIPSESRRQLIDEALEGIGLSEVADKLVRSYSGGMIRRLEIASALLISPKILFLDEPTIGLDPMARKVVWEKLSSFKREFGTTVFFNTHTTWTRQTYTRTR
jgi:ABC-2 type transport system ATP-binding protein